MTKLDECVEKLEQYAKAAQVPPRLLALVKSVVVEARTLATAMETVSVNENQLTLPHMDGDQEK